MATQTETKTKNVRVQMTVEEPVKKKSAWKKFKRGSRKAYRKAKGGLSEAADIAFMGAVIVLGGSVIAGGAKDVANFYKKDKAA